MPQGSLLMKRLQANVFQMYFEAVAYRGGGVWGVQPPPEIPKAFQNRAKLNPIVKNVKNCWI